jgi:hypothetical protein
MPSVKTISVSTVVEDAAKIRGSIVYVEIARNLFRELVRHDVTVSILLDPLDIKSFRLTNLLRDCDVGAARRLIDIDIRPASERPQDGKDQPRVQAAGQGTLDVAAKVANLFPDHFV